MSGRTDVGTYTVSLYKVADEDGRELSGSSQQILTQYFLAAEILIKQVLVISDYFKPRKWKDNVIILCFFCT